MTGPLVTAAAELLAFFKSQGRPVCLIGGMAVSRWGERTCSAEDLIIYKLVAARGIDLHDVQSVVIRQGRAVDVDRIRLWGSRFAEITERPELLDPFEAAWKAMVAGGK